ncbi:hypothetical protein [Haloarcula salina]|uniref:Uncharacterized protein n=1 Tax=Haloarcula salina TaxID=1429914 RepID=A0AA41G292_9EURY|nr:hypothetical protein [Haloarcula salina]MBV0902983.1 hypothetical protein [Haloarcula salina]
MDSFVLVARAEPSVTRDGSKRSPVLFAPSEEITERAGSDRLRKDGRSVE